MLHLCIDIDAFCFKIVAPSIQMAADGVYNRVCVDCAGGRSWQQGPANACCVGCATTVQTGKIMVQEGSEPLHCTEE